jgi:hypothetical protein
MLRTGADESVPASATSKKIANEPGLDNARASTIGRSDFVQLITLPLELTIESRLHLEGRPEPKPFGLSSGTGNATG